MTDRGKSAAAFILLAAALAIAGCEGETTTIPWTPKLVVTGIIPSSGPPAGGTTVTVFGLEFQAGAQVRIGVNNATSVTVVSTTQITCVTPSGSGSADVVVSNLDGKSATLAGGFDFDATPPADVTGFAADGESLGPVEIRLSWTNPADSDFKGCMLRRSTAAYPASPSDGMLVYSGGSTNVVDSGVSTGVRYYYTVFAFDEIPNYSAGSNADAAHSQAPTLTANQPVFQNQAPGGQVLIMAQASDPDGEIASVTADLSAIGGDAAQQLNDNGGFGDQHPWDGIYSYLATIPESAAAGDVAIDFTATDDAGLQACDSETLSITSLLLDLGNDRLEFDAAGSGTSANPAIISSGDAVCAVWSEARQGSTYKKLYSACSTDGGKEWFFGEARVDNNGTGDCLNPKLAAEGNMLYAVWRDLRGATSEQHVHLNSSPVFGLGWMWDRQVDHAAAGTNVQSPCIAASGTNVYVAWTDDSGGSGAFETYFNCSTDRGVTFQPSDIRLDAATTNTSIPQIACWGRCVHVAWLEEIAGGGYHVMYRMSPDGGTSWPNPPQALDPGGNPAEFRLGCSGKDVYVAWVNDPSTASQVRSRSSTDSGVSWAPSVRVDTDATGAMSTNLRMAVDGKNVYLLWLDARLGSDRMFFNASTDGGKTWAIADQCIDHIASGPAASPYVACSVDRVWAAWQDTRSGKTEVYLNFSLDSGSTWQTQDIRPVSALQGYHISQSPVIAASGTDAVIAWLDQRYGSPEVVAQHARSPWSPAAGSQETRIDGATTSTDSYAYQVARWCDEVYAVWEDKRSGWWQIYFASSKDGGSTWTAETRIDHSGIGVDARNPRIACWGDNLCVVWERRPASGGDVVANASANGGTTWNTFDTKVDGKTAGGKSYAPDVACWGPYVYVVWEDDRSGTPQIYCNVSSDGGQSFPLAFEKRINVYGASAYPCDGPRIACCGRNVHAAWSETRGGGGDDVYFNRSSDGGSSWGVSETRLDTDAASAAHSSDVRIAASGTCVHVAWRDRRIGSESIYVNFSNMDGQSGSWLTSDVRMDTHSTGPGAIGHSIACSGMKAYVAWCDNRNGDMNVYLRYAAFMGMNWTGAEIQIDGDTAGTGYASQMPVLAVSGNVVAAFWHDDRDGPLHVYSSRSIDLGAKWQGTQLRVDTGSQTQNSLAPAALVWGTRTAVVWCDQRNANNDIYANTVK